MSDGSRLERLSAICLALPEAKREDSGRHAAFRVRGRWDEVASVVVESYRLCAPKALARSLDV